MQEEIYDEVRKINTIEGRRPEDWRSLVRRAEQSRRGAGWKLADRRWDGIMVIVSRRKNRSCKVDMGVKNGSAGTLQVKATNQILCAARGTTVYILCRRSLPLDLATVEFLASSRDATVNLSVFRRPSTHSFGCCCFCLSFADLACLTPVFQVDGPSILAASVALPRFAAAVACHHCSPPLTCLCLFRLKQILVVEHSNISTKPYTSSSCARTRKILHRRREN